MAEPEFEVRIIENPARRLQSLIEKAGWKGPEDFVIRALDVWGLALKVGDGKIMVEDQSFWKRLLGRAKRYTFSIRNR